MDLHCSTLWNRTSSRSIAYLSGLCNVAYTATQYALLSSVASVGRTMVASSAGVLAAYLGWPDFFMMTTMATLPALLLLLWLMKFSETKPD